MCLGEELYFYVKTRTGDKINPVSVYRLDKMSKKEYSEYLSSLDNKTVLKIKTYSVDSALKKFVKEYEKKNNAEIIFEVFSDDLSIMADTNAYNEKLNAQIISGVADWDILLLDFVDYINLIDRGIFSDIYSIDEKLLESNLYFNNILKACQTNEKLYIFPYSVMISVLYADKELYDQYIDTKLPQTWIWEDLLSLSESIPNDVKLFGALKKSMQPPAINLTMEISSISNAHVINDIKSDMEKEKVIEKIKYNLSYEKEIFDNEKYGSIKPSPKDKGIFILESQLFSDMLTEILTDTSRDLVIINGLSEFNISSNHFYVSKGASIMDYSKNKKAAMDFIKAYSNYSNGHEIGFPVSRNALLNNIESNAKVYFVEDKINQNKLDDFIEYMGKLNFMTYLSNPASLESSYISMDYRMDKINIDQAAEAIYDKLWIYLNE